jgi:hypothetical protein
MKLVPCRSRCGTQASGVHRPFLELNGEWHTKEVQSGVKDPSSGGTTL